MPNPSRFKFSRNRTTSVEASDDGSLRSTSRLVDTFNDMEVSIQVKIPEMEISGIEAVVRRCLDPQEEKVGQELTKLIGVRVGPGMTKIFKGLVSEAATDSQLLFMVEEACHGVILNFTREMATQLPDDQELGEDIFRQMVKSNIRLYNRCAAYGPGSPLVEGIAPPK
ncbi:MAG: hypothetical protein JEZ11_13750 [Desulfobacterales bacterium]|nr:hypothetical protein [Desulfobacterales bacterium]